jgi:hypothetical protein
MRLTQEYSRLDTASEESSNPAAAEKSSNKIRGSLKKILASKASYQEDFANKDGAPPYAVYTIEDFCMAHCISKAHFYVLLRKGEAPPTFTVGRRRLIARDAALAWVRQNETLAAVQPTGEADR